MVQNEIWTPADHSLQYVMKRKRTRNNQAMIKYLNEVTLVVSKKKCHRMNLCWWLWNWTFKTPSLIYFNRGLFRDCFLYDFARLPSFLPTQSAKRVQWNLILAVPCSVRYVMVTTRVVFCSVCGGGNKLVARGAWRGTSAMERWPPQ